MPMDDAGTNHRDTANRRLRLVELLDEYEVRAEFTRKFDLNESYIHQLITGKAPFGERAARKLEKQIGLAHGYFDESSDGSKRPYPGAGASTVAQKLAERVRELGATGKLSDAKAQMVLDLVDALTDSGAQNADDGTDSGQQSRAA